MIFFFFKFVNTLLALSLILHTETLHEAAYPPSSHYHFNTFGFFYVGWLAPKTGQ